MIVFYHPYPKNFLIQQSTAIKTPQMRIIAKYYGWNLYTYPILQKEMSLL